MGKSAGLSGRIVEALSAEESPLREESVDFTIDFVLDLKVDDLIDPEATHALIVATLSEGNARNYIERHGLPGWDRYLARCASSGVTLGRFVPDAVQAQIDEALMDSELPEAKWTAKVFEPALIRELLSPVVQQSLINFTKRLPIPGLGNLDGAAAGLGGLGVLAGRFKKSAAGAFDKGKGLLGGLGADLERRVQDAAKDFSATAMSEGRHALQARLKSDEGRRIMSEIRRHFISAMMDTTLAELNEDTQRYPVAELKRLVPTILAASMAEPFIVDALSEEITAFLEVEGKRTLREILEEAGTLDMTREAIREHWAPQARSYFADPRFGAWIDKLLAL